MTQQERRLQPRKQPRQVRAELTRRRILSAAAHVFAEHGYAAGTTNRIAERARISIGSLYQYFPNKDAILAELLVRHLDNAMEALTRSRQAGLPDTLEDLIRGYVRTVIDNHLDDPNLLRVMLEQAPRSGALLDRTARYKRGLVSLFQDALDSYPEAHVHDKETAARLVVTTVELTVHQLIAAPDPVDLTRLENEMVAMLTNYLTAGG